jgi:SAM-dependent methyltransferase
MMNAPAARPYYWLAQYYDDFFSQLRSPLDTARERLLRRILPSVETACDLACGTGTTAVSLAQRGIRTYALDLSPQMCRLTREKVRRAKVHANVLRADMLSFKLPERVNLITCEGDALNHIPARKDLRSVARCVARALRPGGYFFFNINTPIGFRKYWTSTVCIERPGVVMVMRSGHSSDALKAWSDIDLFVRQGTGWQRRHERVEEVCWTRDEIRHTFLMAGFDQLRAWDAAPFFRDNSMISPGCYTIYLARKG